MAVLRWSVYRDRSPLADPLYLGDVEALDKCSAITAGERLHGTPVVAHRSTGAPSPASLALLERAVRRAEKRRGMTNRDRGRGYRGPRGKPLGGDS